MLVDLLKTDRTYKTRENAVKALKTALDKCGVENATYIIGCNEKGRFAPAVLLAGDERVQMLSLIHHGVTVMGNL